MSTPLNAEQLLAVQHPMDASACLIAGAGSGKTRVLTERVRWLIGTALIAPARILGLTFTNKAAGEMMYRLGVAEDDSHKDSPYISTIHSIALSYIRKSPGGFGFRGRITPLDDYEQEQMLKKIIEKKIMGENGDSYASIEAWLVKDKIDFHRARGMGFQVEYTPEYHEKTLGQRKGYHALKEEELDIWHQYQCEKQAAGLIDFADMIHMPVRRSREDMNWLKTISGRFQHVLVDESQDLSKIQWDFVNLHLSPDNKNLYAVGDSNQCQPPWSKIKIVVKPPRGRHPAVCEKRAISEIRENDLAVVWSKGDQITYSTGRKIRVASRFYSGPMLKIYTSMGSTECTPNHWNWVRFNKNTVGKYVVYLMHRSDLGYRIGMSAFKRKNGGGKSGTYGLSVRFNQEKAEKEWILRVCNTRPEAEAWEEKYSLKYGIPESLFDAKVCLHKTSELIDPIFSNPNGGIRCLSDHGLLVNYPILVNRASGFKGWFKTASANILPSVMDIPIEGRNKSAVINILSSQHYDGLVYSLDVEKDHTYIADGLVVGNSIYGFNGASPELFKEYSEGWRGDIPALYHIKRNHRSVPEIVALANAIQKKMSDTIHLKMESWRGLNGEHGKTKLLQATLPIDIAEIIAREIYMGANRTTPPIPYKGNAILVRAASQIREIEGELVKLRIPYIVRGGRGLLGTEEVRDVLSYLRLAVNPNDYMAFTRAVSIPRRGIGKAALMKLREVADFKHNGNLIDACQIIDKLNAFVLALRKIQGNINDASVALDAVFNSVGYVDYLKEKYGHEPHKVIAKVENLKRLTMLVKGLTETGCVTTEDVVFRLTMEKAAEGDPQGQVIISTIHAAKGLEFYRVYVFGVVEGLLPHQFSMGSPAELDEERRLFYVAVTRARDMLILCVPSMVQPQNSSTRRAAPSRFLSEVGIVVTRNPE